MCIKFKEYCKSDKFKCILGVIAIIIIALIIFSAGIAVGHRKAGFSYRFGDNYRQTFGERGQKQRGGNMMNNFWRGGMMGGDFTTSRGTSGKIISINLPTIAVEGKDNIEKIILVKGDTKIMNLRNTVTSSDLKIDDSIVVFGTPNDQAQIEAKLIRVISSATPTSTQQ